MADSSIGPSGLRDIALRLDYMVGQITPGEFRWQDANFDRDSALGRELLFLIADDEWVRATSETIDITRPDTVATTIKIDVDLDRITHEAFFGRTGRFWLPVLVLPPLRQRLPEPDPFSTLTVTDAIGNPLVTLPNADVRHRIAAALTEIIVNFAVARLPEAGMRNVSATRDHRLLLSAAIYRLLRNDHVPTAVMEVMGKGLPAWQAGGGRLPRIDRVRRELGDLLRHYSRLLTVTSTSQDDAVRPSRPSFARQLTERAIWVLRAFSESTVVVVAAEREHTPMVLTVTVPNRALHEQPSGGEAPGPSTAWRWARPASWHWLRPGNWILPKALLRIDLLLPSADADRRVEVNMPDGVSPDPSRPLEARAELDIRTEQPLPITQLAELTDQLARASADWPLTLYQCLADLASAKADAARETLRNHRVGAAMGEPAMPAGESTSVTRTFRDHLEKLRAVLGEISAQTRSAGVGSRLKDVWSDGDWLDVPMQRRTSPETVSPDVVVARAGMIEDVSQRAAPTEARIRVHVAVVDSEYYSTATFSGRMSALLMTVVLMFFVLAQAVGISGQQVSAEVLAFVLTLFSAVQAGRIERADRSTLRGLLAPAGNPLIIASILPTVILAVALAFSRSTIWAIAWASACTGLQVLLLWLLRRLLSRALAQGRGPVDGTHRPAGFMLHTDHPDYSHTEVLHSSWWRSTTADALMVGRQAYGYVIWQHETPQTLRSVLHGGRPADESAPPSARRLPDWRRIRRPLGPSAQTPDSPLSPKLAAGDEPAAWPDGGSGIAGGVSPGISPLEQPANVLALQRSSIRGQSLTFAVFRDEPKADWDCAPEDVLKVDLDPGQLAPLEDTTGVVGVFLGLDPAYGMLPVPEHPVTAVLRAAAHHRLTVLEVQLPLPAPAAAYADLRWARVQISLQDGDVGRLAPFLSDIQRLTAMASGQRHAPEGRRYAPDGQGTGQPLVGVQTVAEGIPRILNPRPAAANPGPAAEQAEAGPVLPVLASDLDVVAGSGPDQSESATAKTWRLMAICADWRGGADIQILDSLDTELQMAGMTYAILHGKAVLLLLAHRTGGVGRKDDLRSVLAAPNDSGEMTVCLDRWQSRKDLGAAQGYLLLRVHMRTPDRPGATLEVLEALRETLQEMAPSSLGENDWNVWYARVVAVGSVARIQLTVRLATDAATPHSQAQTVERWGTADFPKIGQRTLALAAHKMAAARRAGISPDPGLDTPEDTVISVGLVSTPDLAPSLDPAQAPAPQPSSASQPHDTANKQVPGSPHSKLTPHRGAQPEQPPEVR